MSNVFDGVFYFKRALCSALVVGSLGLASGCGDETVMIGEVDLVAKVEGTDIFIGIVADDKDVTAYACNGKDGQETPLTQWFYGTNDSGSFTLEDGMSGTFAEDGSASGTYTDEDGYKHPFSAQAATDDEGTYFSERDRLDGWVVIGNDMRGAVLNRGTDSNIANTSFNSIGTKFDLSAGSVLVVNDEEIGAEVDSIDLVELFVTKATILKWKFEPSQ